jgi:hypothetical protein
MWNPDLEEKDTKVEGDLRKERGAVGRRTREDNGVR